MSRVIAEMVASLGDYQHLLLSTIEGELAGWLLLERNSSPLTDHWARVTRVQTDLPYRGRNIGVDMMLEAARAARENFNLEQLRMEVRGGEGLEDYYSRLGWRVIGRWPAALRLDDADYRDEVLMVLSLRGQEVVQAESHP